MEAKKSSESAKTQQLDRCKRKGLMHATFAALANDLDPKFQELVAMSPVRYNKLPKILPTRAIYLFSENGKHLYVGRTNGLRRRLRGHCVPSATSHSGHDGHLIR